MSSESVPRLQPSLETRRLILRPFALTDAPEVQTLAGEREIAETTLNIPFPYEDGLADQWIRTHRRDFEQGRVAIFAIVRQSDGLLIGAIGFVLTLNHGHGELGYWIGRPFWNKGYCSEAAEEMLRYGFEELNLHRIHAHHFTRNPASGRVMEKIGMQHEGRMREHVKKWDHFEDIEIYGILRSEFERRA
ncbi:GNAT family N-acetyltransferase [bacterium]|nr:GNAT family N-acetyltransferase [bacterium]